MIDLLIERHPPDVGFLEDLHPARSASEYDVTCIILESFGFRFTFSSFVHTRYLSRCVPAPRSSFVGGVSKLWQFFDCIRNISSDG